MSNADESAFGHAAMDAVEGLIWCSGFTKREYFAGLAMQGYCSIEGTWGGHEDRLAELSVKAADALIKELSKEKAKIGGG